MASAISVDNKNLEMFCLIWLDSNTMHDDRNTEQKLRSIINQLIKFQNVDQCQKFIQETTSTDRLIMIVSGQLGKEILPKIYHIRQVISIYIYCTDKKVNEQWSSKYSNIKNIVTSLDELIKVITNDHKIEMKLEEPLSINMFSTNGKSTVGLNGKFVFFQILIDCLLRLKSIDEDKNELIEKLKQQYHDNRYELSYINDFKIKYQSDQALKWYTNECFFYKTLNSVLRTEDIHLIFLYRSFIFDIQQQLQKCQTDKILTLYRAQIISKNEFETLKQSINEFISINSFFSTSSNYSKALAFFNLSKITETTEKILFKIEANPNVAKTKPFANISKFSAYPHEEEILFMIGSIFQLKKISFDKKNQFWLVEMTLSSDDNNQLKYVLTHIKQQNGEGETDLRMLAKILSGMGKFDLAKTYLQRYLQQLPSNDFLRGDLYEDLATVASQSGDFDKSMEWHKQSIEFKQNNPNNSFSIRLYNQAIVQMKNLMIHMDKLQEYTTPRYFFILPAKDYNLEIIDFDQNLLYLHYKLYFLCDCLNDPGEFHIVQHEGYTIRNFKEFISKFGQYLQITLNFVKMLISSKEQNLSQQTHTTTVYETAGSRNHFDNIKYKINFIQKLLQKPEIKRMYVDFSLNGKTNSELSSIHAEDFGEFEKYLQHNNPIIFLSNLYRIITSDGQIRWICQKDYDALSYNKINNDFIKQIENIGGKYFQESKQLIFYQLKLTSTNVKLIIKIFKNGCIISKLFVKFCSIYEGDFDILMDVMINRSSIQYIEIDNLNILNYFGFSKYISQLIKISFSNNLLSVSFNGSFQDGTKYLFIRFLKQNKIYRTLQISISADGFGSNKQDLQECLDANIQFNRFIINDTNDIDILDTIFQSKNKQIQYLKLNNSYNLSTVKKRFCQLIQTNETLVELDLIDSIDFSNEFFLEDLFSILQQHNSIKQFRLHISSIKYPNKNEIILIDFLKNYQYLTHLRLSKSYISRKLIQNLIDNIQNYHSIIHLEFLECKFNEDDIQPLILLENKGILHNFIYTKQRQKISLSNLITNDKIGSILTGLIIIIITCALFYQSPSAVSNSL